jgi:hypothetical protein
MEFTQNNQFTSYQTLLDISTISFRNPDYILKLNNNPTLKFFKDELTIKYVGKGYNSIDYAVNNIIY